MGAAPDVTAVSGPPVMTAAVAAPDVVPGDDPFAGLDATPSSGDGGDVQAATVLSLEEEAPPVATPPPPSPPPPARPDTSYSHTSAPAPAAPAPKATPPAPEGAVSDGGRAAVAVAKGDQPVDRDDFRARFFDMPAGHAAAAEPGAPVAAVPAPGAAVPDAANLELGDGRQARGPVEVVGEPVRVDVKWQLRVQGSVQGPLEFAEILELVRRGTLRKTDEAAPLGEPFRQLTSYPLLARQMQSSLGIPMTSAARGGTASSPLRRVAFVVTFLAAALGGALYGWAPDIVDEQIQRFTSTAAQVAGAEVDNPIRPHLESWRVVLGEPGGPPEEYIGRARTQLRVGTVAAALEAEQDFRRALLAAPGDVRAVAGLVEARARVSPAARPDDQVSLDTVMAFASTMPAGGVEVPRAAAALALLRGDRARASEALARAQQLAPDDPEVLILLALSQLHAPHRARGHIRRSLELLPDNGRARAVAGMVHRRLGEFGAAVEYLEARVEEDPRDALAARELAHTYFDQGLVRKGTRRLEESIALQPDLDTAWLLTHVLLATPGGQRRVDPILAGSSKLAQHHRLGGALLALRAQTLRASGNAQQALVVAEDSAKRFGRNARVQATLAEVYMEGGRLVDARAAYGRANALVGAADEVLMVALLAARLDVLGGLEIKTAYRAALDVAPERPGPRLAEAVAFAEAGQAEEAASVLFGLMPYDPAHYLDRPLSDTWRPAFSTLHARAKRVRGKSTSLKLLNGVTAFYAGESKAAMAQLRAVLKADKSQPVALFYLAVLELRADMVAAAYRRLQLLDAHGDRSSPAVLLYLARATLRAGDVDLGVTRASRIPEEARLIPERETLLGDVAAARGQLGKARFQYQRALVKDPLYLPPKLALKDLPVEVTD